SSWQKFVEICFRITLRRHFFLRNEFAVDIGDYQSHLFTPRELGPIPMACSLRTFISRHCSSKMSLPFISVWEKEVSFDQELTGKSRLFQEHLHEHPRVGASSISDYIALHHCPALLHCH